MRRIGLIATLLVAACGGSDSPWAPPPDPPPPPKEAMYLELDQGDVSIADGIVNDIWPARGFPAVKIAWPLKWTEDPYNDAFFRFMFYSLRYTEHLLFAYRNTKDQKYLDKLYAILRSYIAYQPNRPYDHHKFDNEHATAYRSMVLTNLYVKLAADKILPADIDAGLTASIERMATFLMDPRRFEYWANHGFTEAAALVVMGHNFPKLANADSWRKTGITRLETMRTSNIDPDGVDIENSPFYHLFVLGLVSQIQAWAKEFEPAIAPAWEGTKREMIHYLAYVTQPNGRLPMLGATGTTIVANQDPELYGPLAALDPEYAYIWTNGGAGTAPKKRVELFPSSGLFVLRADAKGNEQSFVTFDAGVYRTDHSHLDALGVSIYSDDATLFPDGGLFTYDLGDEYDYFHGTRAHNTVVVDGGDQTEGAATPGTYGVASGAAWATGESKLYAGVVHRRTVIIVEQGAILVTDALIGTAPHDYTQTWHAFPGAELAMDGLDANFDNIKAVPIVLVRQSDPDGLTVKDIMGQEKPLQGWISQAYGKKVAVHALEYTRHATTTEFATLFVTGRRARSGNPARVVDAHDPNARVIHVCADGIDKTVTITAEGTVMAKVAISGGGCTNPPR